jgi:hypothetical protein
MLIVILFLIRVHRVPFCEKLFIYIIYSIRIIIKFDTLCTLTSINIDFLCTLYLHYPLFGTLLLYEIERITSVFSFFV